MQVLEVYLHVISFDVHLLLICAVDLQVRVNFCKHIPPFCAFSQISTDHRVYVQILRQVAVVLLAGVISLYTWVYIRWKMFTEYELYILLSMQIAECYNTHGHLVVSTL